jgi:nicotinamide phosphoribosyltransferase
MNLIIDTDSYKASHWLQYPPGTANLFNYLESRGGAYDRQVFFGLQYLLNEYLTKPVTEADVLEAAEFFKAHGVPFNKDGWMGIVTKYGGYIPMSIKAVKEGSVLPTKLPLLTAEATDPEFFWVVGWFETMIMRLWYPITVATLSWHVKQTIKKYLNETADDLSGLPFKLHDFGSRGVSSRESAAVGGAAHLVNFQGSDTVVGVDLANRCYYAPMAAFSIPAAEHSTITSWGQDHEEDAYRNMLTQFARPGSILAVVSDSYDIYEATRTLWGEKLHDEVVASGATVVIRPDSGDPVQVVNKLLYILEGKFGSKLNTKGYRVLNHVRVIQGDGINPHIIELILKSAKLAGFSADNLAFGMGGGLLQQVNRDTLKFAYKCSSIAVADPTELKAFLADISPESSAKLVAVERDVFKNPIDDAGKKSKVGRIGTKLVVEGDPRSGPVTERYEVCSDRDPANLLEPVYYNGRILREQTFADVRRLSEK